MWLPAPRTANELALLTKTAATAHQRQPPEAHRCPRETARMLPGASGEKPAQESGGRRGVARRPNRALGRSGRDQAPGTRGAPRASARFRRVGKEEPVGAGRCTRPAWVKDPTSPGGTGRDRTRVRGGWVLQGRCPWTPSNLRVPSPLFPGGRPDPLPPRQIAAPHCARVCGFLALAPPSGASSRAEASLDSEDFQGQRDTRSTGSLGGPISLAIHIV